VPIFMDRHDLRGLKADDVAEAHRRDVDIQDRHGVKYMAYWFDEQNGAAFCLVHAPDPATAERVHREAHGEIPNAIIPVDLATVSWWSSQCSFVSIWAGVANMKTLSGAGGKSCGTVIV
jgi:hypothetical protein